MRRVFLDTVGLLALWDSADQWHPAAEQSMSEISKYPCEFFTSDSVLLECGNASARKVYRSDVVDLRNSFSQSNRILVPSMEEIESAWLSYQDRLRGSAGIVDQLSFVLMNRVGITDAFTNDEHFRAAGFVTLF